MMRGTAVGATWDAVEEFNEALSAEVSFKGAAIIAQTARVFPAESSTYRSIAASTIAPQPS
jgi:hypothetical protein